MDVVPSREIWRVDLEPKGTIAGDRLAGLAAQMEEFRRGDVETVVVLEEGAEKDPLRENQGHWSVESRRGTPFSMDVSPS